MWSGHMYMGMVHEQNQVFKVDQRTQNFPTYPGNYFPNADIILPRRGSVSPFGIPPLFSAEEHLWMLPCFVSELHRH